MNYRQSALISSILSIVCLFVPFVRMKIGPNGYLIYGPTVPDVYIYGGAITGKDMNGSGIAAAWVLQLVAILAFISFSIVIHFIKKKSSVMFLLIIQLLLLVLFPIWLKFYTQMVINNSDGADLTLSWQVGIMIYWVLLGLKLLAFIQAFRSKDLV